MHNNRDHQLQKQWLTRDHQFLWRTLNLDQSKEIEPIYNIRTSIVQETQLPYCIVHSINCIGFEKDKLFGTPHLICLPPKILCWQHRIYNILCYRSLLTISIVFLPLFPRACMRCWWEAIKLVATLAATTWLQRQALAPGYHLHDHQQLESDLAPAGHQVLPPSSPATIKYYQHQLLPPSRYATIKYCHWAWQSWGQFMTVPAAVPGPILLFVWIAQNNYRT